MTALQNGLALAGDYMSAASFLGIAGLVALSGFDGLIYSIGFLVGWPVVLCLIAEPLRNLGRYTFADVVAFRLQQRPVRVASAFGGLAVIAFYLIAQMVGAGNLIRLLFGLSYEVAVMIVGVVMLAYVLFGGMLATTWVQIVKAVLLMTGAALLALLVLMRYSLNPLALFADAASRYGDAVLAPGAPGLGSDRRDLARHRADVRHRRPAAHPDALLHRARRPHRARVGGLRHRRHRRLLPLHLHPRLRRDGDRRPGRHPRHRRRRQHGGAAAGRGRGRPGVPRLHRRRGLRDDPRGGRRPDAGRRGGAVARHLGQRRARTATPIRGEQLRVARGATILLAIVSIALGIAFKGQNVAYMVGLAFAIAASANFPALVLSMFWKPFTTMGAVASIVVGTATALGLIYLSPAIQVDLLKHPAAMFPLRNPGIISIPLSFAVGIVVSLLAARRGGGGEVRGHRAAAAPGRRGVAVPAR